MQNKDITEILEYFKLGKFNLAEKRLAKLIQKLPENYVLYNLYGIILASQSKFTESIKQFKKAININSNISEAHYNLGNALSRIEKYSEAIDSYYKAIKIKSDYEKAYNNLGIVFAKINKIDQSIYCYNKSIKIKPNYADPYFNLGIAQNKIGKINEAIENFKKANEVKPDYQESLNKLAKIYVDIGKTDEAQKCFEKLIRLNPNNIEYKINKSLMISPMAQSNEEIDSIRKNYLKNIEELKNFQHKTIAPFNEIELNSFYLAYHARNNFKIIKETANLFSKMIPGINYVSKNIKKSTNNKKIKIGFISEFLTEHTVGKIFGGFIKNINRKKFEVIVIHVYKEENSIIQKEINDSVNKVVILSNNIQEQQNQIEKENLDILFYPDIGMSPTTYFLAFSRLAPIQIVSWGHTETSGINSIDYFLSSSLFEVQNANKKYSEKLICLNEFPSFYETPKNIGPMKDRSDLKLPENSNLYGCPQSLFKFHPDFDEILAKILIKDKKGYIVLIGGDEKFSYWIESLKNRWSKSFSVLNERVIFTDRLSVTEFISLSNCVDVLLIPLHFGGGNTTLETMMVGTPSITMEGEYLRTNITAAVYKQMKIAKPPIAKNSEEYIDLAISLAQNKDKNKSLREESKNAAKKYLYNNLKALDEFEKCLEKVHHSLR